MIELGAVTVSEAEIVDFATRFDPQPFHVDAEAARRSPFHGLIASGWHTCALFMRQFTTEVLNRSHSLGSPGVEELRWLKPVRPGDVLRGRYEVLEVSQSQSRPGRGTVRARGLMVNQAGDVVLTLIARNHFVSQSASGLGGA